MVLKDAWVRSSTPWRNNWACSLRVTTEGSINNSGMLLDTKCLLIYFPVHSFVFLNILNISLLSFILTEENVEEEVKARVPCGKKTLSLGCLFSLDHNTELSAPSGSLGKPAATCRDPPVALLPLTPSQILGALLGCFHGPFPPPR